MPNVMTIIAYMSDGETYCRGCLMERWGASLEVAIFEEVGDAANFIANKLYENEQFKTRDDIGKWDINVLINGKNTNSSNWASNNDDLVQQDWSPELTEPEAGLLNLLKGRVSYQSKEIVDAAKAKLEQERIAAEARAKLESLRAEERARENRRRMLADLKKEFPDD